MPNQRAIEQKEVPDNVPRTTSKLVSLFTLGVPKKVRENEAKSLEY